MFIDLVELPLAMVILVEPHLINLPEGENSMIQQILRVFLQMVSREELTALLDERASSSPQLKSFLSKVAQGLGLVVSQGYDALFDMIEGDDDGGLSWAEFEGFFMAAVS